jgi:D-sedoheptulose 7-phosphate isomerase
MLDADGPSLTSEAPTTGIERSIEASITVQSTLHQQIQRLLEIAERLAAALRADHKVLAFGNGGSAAQAQHLAGELVGRFQQERPALAAMALTTDPTVLTALGNDYGYPLTFRRQVEALGRPGDVAVALSTSGNSPNILEAIEEARLRGLFTIGLTGQPGGRLAELVDLCLRVPSSATPRIQEAHLLIIHLVCEQLETLLFGPPVTVSQRRA